jgi:HAMP domain-containing protein
MTVLTHFIGIWILALIAFSLIYQWAAKNWRQEP